MTTTNRLRPADALRAAVNRVRAALPLAPAPAYVEPVQDGEVAWLRRLDRVRAALEQTRADLQEQGWTGGAWFSVPTEAGFGRPATPTEAYALLAPGGAAANACLVGTLLQRANDPDRTTSVDDVWGSVDELVEALHEANGYDSYPPGWTHPPARRYERLRVLTTWNDEPGRSRDEVVALVDRAIGRTIVGACHRA